jgi:alpha-glucosidase
MDYTPGAMDNAHKENYTIRWKRPMSMGTRCHQVAMYVIYDSPLQMLCDNPSNYYREKESTAFISRIPTTWNETIILEAKIGEHIVMARRHGNDWYVAAMGVEAKTFDVKMDFLYGKEYEMSIMQDGINADNNAQDYKRIERTADKWSPLVISMAKGGGFVALLKLKK